MTDPQRLTSQKTLLVMAGGTGGHIFPGIAVAEELVKRGWHIEWLGTADRMEADIVPAHGFTIHFLNVKGLRGKGVLQKLQSVIALIGSLFQALRIIRRVNPNVVLGMGGYASGPGGLAARLCNKPLVIHEQNAVLGMTNKLLSRIASKILLGFGQAKVAMGNVNAVEVTGNPVRQGIVQAVRAERSDGNLNILVVGGSLGARPFNQALPDIFDAVPSISVWHQTGKDNAESVTNHYAKLPSIDSKVTEFISDMSQAYQWADIVICRAGAITVSEIAMAGVAAIFIPLPHAVDDHQTQNASSLVERRAGFLISQERMHIELAPLLVQLQQQPGLLSQTRLNALDCGISDAAQRVASIIESQSPETRTLSTGALL